MISRFGPWLIIAGGLGVAFFIYRHFKVASLAADIQKDTAVKANDTAVSTCLAKGGTLRPQYGYQDTVNNIAISDCLLPETNAVHVAVNYGGCPTIVECQGYDARYGVTATPPSAPTGVSKLTGLQLNKIVPGTGKANVYS